MTLAMADSPDRSVPLRLAQPAWQVLGHLVTQAAAALDDRLEALLREPRVPAEPVHQVRVGCRRLAALVDVLREACPQPALARWRDAIRKTRRRCGDVRDLDVQLAWLEKQFSAVSDAERPGLEACRDLLRRRRQRRAAELAGRLQRLRSRLSEAAGEVALIWRGLHADDPPDVPTFADWACHALRAQLADFADRVPGKGAPRTAWHALRISGKRLRYLSEFIAAAAGTEAHVVPALKRLQDELGEFQDATVAGAQWARLARKLKRRIRDAGDRQWGDWRSVRPGVDWVQAAHERRLRACLRKLRALRAGLQGAAWRTSWEELLAALELQSFPPTIGRPRNRLGAAMPA